MICIRCNHDSKFRERMDRRCPSCRGEFAFEPKQGDRFTDKAFQAAIDAVSARGQVRWGVEHLYYEVCRRYRRRQTPRLATFLILALFLGLLALLFAANSGPVWFPLSALTAIGVWWAVRKVAAGSKTVRLSLEAFNLMWSRWLQAHGKPKGLIERQTPARKPRAAEPDLGDYSFDRAVICDRARTVDLLLANNFHFENNCAVLAVGGYPQGPFEIVRAMLKRNPRLQVFALHDASVSGCKLACRLAGDPAWFKGQVRVIDIGLRPIHAKPFKGLWQLAGLSECKAGDGLTADEAQWLKRYTLELAAIRPEQVLKRLFRAMNRKRDDTRDPSGSGDGGGSEGDGSTSVHFSSAGGRTAGERGESAPGYDFAVVPGDEAPGLDFEVPEGEGAVGYDFFSFSVEAGDSDDGADSFG